jgi:hypothetical protein
LLNFDDPTKGAPDAVEDGVTGLDDCAIVEVSAEVSIRDAVLAGTADCF